MFSLRYSLIVTLLITATPNLSHAWTQYCDSTLPIQHPSSQYTDHGDGTVTDNRSKLMWKKCSIGETTQDCIGDPDLLDWKEAHLAASTANSQGFAGYTNWRLPNIKELMSLIERSCERPAINLSIFPIKELGDGFASPSNSFWSSTPSFSDAYGDINTKALSLNSTYEVMPRSHPKTDKAQVRLVRSPN